MKKTRNTYDTATAPQALAVPTGTNLLALVPAFCEWLRGRDCRPRTVQGYRNKVELFGRWAGERPFNLETCRAYRDDLQREGRRPRTIRVAFTALKSLRLFLLETGACRDLPPLEVKLPRMDRPIRNTPTEAQVEALFTAAESWPTNTGRRRFVRARALAILALLAYCGLRRQELLALEAADLDMDGKRVFIRCGKGGESGWVPLNEDALRHLEHWRAVRGEWCRRHCHNTDALFPADSARRLADRGLDALWNQLLAAAGIEKRFTVHGLRHSFATRVAKAAGVMTASRLLRHARVETTLQYLHTTPEEMRAAVEALSRPKVPPAPIAPELAPRSGRLKKGPPVRHFPQTARLAQRRAHP